MVLTMYFAFLSPVVSRCALGQMIPTFAKIYNTLPCNIPSQKPPEQLLRSGLMPFFSGVSFLPVPSLPRTPCRAWSMNRKLNYSVFIQQIGPDFCPLLGTQTGLARSGENPGMVSQGISRFGFPRDVGKEDRKGGEKNLPRGRERGKWWCSFKYKEREMM